jgi:hypothetical protein
VTAAAAPLQEALNINFPLTWFSSLLSTRIVIPYSFSFYFIFFSGHSLAVSG